MTGVRWGGVNTEGKQGFFFVTLPPCMPKFPLSTIYMLMALIRKHLKILGKNAVDSRALNLSFYRHFFWSTREREKDQWRKQLAWSVTNSPNSTKSLEFLWNWFHGDGASFETSSPKMFPGAKHVCQMPMCSNRKSIQAYSLSADKYSNT